MRKGDVVIVKASELIPGDGEIIEGAATVDESAITGESAPVVREAGGDRSAVTGGTRVLSDVVKIRITSNPGETFLDRMIGLVEGAKRQRTPNEIALTILLSALTLIFLIVLITLKAYGIYAGVNFAVTVLVALLVCLIPTTIGGLLNAIGIAGIDRLVQANVLAMSGRAVEAAGDVDVLLLDKTGTITLGNRQAVAFHAAPGVSENDLAASAQLSSLADETPEGRSIAVLAKEKFGLRARDMHELAATFVPFTAQTRMSGVDLHATGTQPTTKLRKGSADAVQQFVQSNGGVFPQAVTSTVDEIARRGGTPLVVAAESSTLGVIELKDIVKGGLSERFARFRAMGIRTVMITGDNPLTAAAIAKEAGMDDFLAQAKPEDKLELIRKEQIGGRMVAMTGDGTNDAPALAQADVGVAMNTGTQAAKEAGNMVDLDSNPTKLIEIVEIGKQLLDHTRRAHDLQHRERRREIFRHHSRDVAGDVPANRAAQHHEPSVAHERDFERRHFQCAHYRRAHSARATRRKIPSARRRENFAAQPAHLRRRRRHHSVHRHQGDRPSHHFDAPRLNPNE